MDRYTLKERAANIGVLANNLSEELARQNIAEPTFEHGLAPEILCSEPDSGISIARTRLLQKVDELWSLLVGPTKLLTAQMRDPVPYLHPIIRLGIAEHFPPEGTTVQDLAAELNLRESLVRRLLAGAASYLVYSQDKPDHFVHTAASRLLSNSEGMRRFVLFGAEEVVPATLKSANALVDHPNSEEPENCGWTLQNHTKLPIFKALEDMPDRALSFGNAMRGIAELPGNSPQFLVDNFPWPSLSSTHSDESNPKPFTIVDVGGGLGHISLALAEHDATSQFIVEDSADLMLQGQLSLPPPLTSRIRFQAHDFFQPQPISNADVYLLRMILHNWSDKYASAIIRALIPALKPGAKIVVNDCVIPAPGEVHYLQERGARDYDMYMLALQNGKERTRRDFEVLFRDVDERFQVTDVKRPGGSLLAVVEVTWMG